jgi:phosphatidylglycerophosphate synthase
MSFPFLLLIAATMRAARGATVDDEPGMPAFIAATVSSILLTYIVLRLDERRLSKEQYLRAWLPASQMAAYLFAPLSLLVHFVRTRRSVGGGLLGMLVVVVVSVAGELVARATEWLVTP